MGEDASQVLREVGSLATTLGPALQPTEYGELVRSITAIGRRAFSAAACSIAVLDQPAQELVFYSASGGSDEIVGRRIPVGEGIAGYVIATGQPLAISDVARDPRFSPELAASIGYVPRSIIAVPLTTKQRLIGVIEVLDADDTRTDMTLLHLIADQAALAIEGAQVFSNLGEVLLSAAARSSGGELGTTLHELALEATPGRKSMTRLAACFNDLAELGDDEVDSALTILEACVTTARKRNLGL